MAQTTDPFAQYRVKQQAAPAADPFAQYRVQQQTPPTAAATSPDQEEEDGLVMSAIKGVGNSIKDLVVHPIENAPNWGGMIGGAIGGTAGSILPGAGTAGGAMGGAALGGATGEAIREFYDWATGDTKNIENINSPLDVAAHVAGQGALQGVTEGAGRLVGLAGKGLKAGAQKWVISDVKPSRAITRMTGAFRRTGSLAEGEKELGQNILEHIGPTTQKAATSAHDTITELNREVHNQIARHPQMARMTDVTDPLNAEVNTSGTKWGTSRQMQADAMKAIQDFTEQPNRQMIQAWPAGQPGLVPAAVAANAGQIPHGPTIPYLSAADLQTWKETIGKQLPWGETGQPYEEAQKRLYMDSRDWLNRVPGVAERNAKESAMLPAVKAVDEAIYRKAKNNVGNSIVEGAGVVGSAATGSLEPLLRALEFLGFKRAVNSGYGPHLMNQAGKRLDNRVVKTVGNRGVPQLIRMLMAQSGQSSE